MLPAVRTLEVPLVVRLGERMMTVREVTSLVPGAIIELPKSADSDLELLVNNHVIARGLAVKVGENFGIRITSMGDQPAVVAESEPEPREQSEADLSAIAEAMLSGQG